MFKVYVLKSLITENYYIGQTDNLERRLNEHNKSKIYWTRRYAPWKIIYTEEFNQRIDALKREKYFKSHAGRNWLKAHNKPQ